MKWVVGFTVVVSLLLGGGSRVSADQELTPYDYLEYVEGGRYVFAMLAEGQSGRVESIRTYYHQSGLYDRSDLSEPLWTVDWYAFGVKITADGNYLVRWGEWPERLEFDELAVAFYERGKLLASYQVNSLVAEPEKLPTSVSHYTWAAETHFNDVGKELYVRTHNGEEFRFDIKTGAVIEGPLIENPPIDWGLWFGPSLMCTVVVLPGLLLVFILKRIFDSFSR